LKLALNEIWRPVELAKSGYRDFGDNAVGIIKVESLSRFVIRIGDKAWRFGRNV